MNRFFASCAVFVALNHTPYAATIYVPSMSRSDMVNALASASQCDTLVFPAGTADYSSTVPVTKAVTMQFAGANQSVISNTSGSSTTFVLSFLNTGVSAVRVTGLTINGSRSSSGIHIDGNSRNVRIDHCVINECVDKAVEFWGFRAYGVVDHCSFTNNKQALTIYGGGGGNNSWTTKEDSNFGSGTTNGVWFEDNTVFYDNNSLGGELPLEMGLGGRGGVRNNTFKSTASRNIECLDAHGNLLLYPNDHRGTIYAIFENNLIDFAAMYRSFYLRGGQVILINNKVTNPNGLISLTEEEGWRFSPVKAVWPAQDQITNSWFVGNTVGGVAVDAAYITNRFEMLSDRIFIQPGRDFVVKNDVKEIPPFGTNHPLIPGGWYGYTPMVYPHPRVTADSERAKPTAPTNIQVGESP
jgi:hypothetical protein